MTKLTPELTAHPGVLDSTQMSVSVYTVTRRETGDQYVGISKNPAVRWKSHRWHARHGSAGHFHRALAKYGPEAFDWVVVAVLPTLPEAQIAERILIAIEQPEYNMSAGGDGNWGYVPNAETRARMSAAHTGRKHPPRAAECRALQSAHRKGKALTPEHRAAIGRGVRNCGVDLGATVEVRPDRNMLPDCAVEN